MKKKIINQKKYEHIAVDPETKIEFETLRYNLIGKKSKSITQDELLNILLKRYNGKENEK